MGVILATYKSWDGSTKYMGVSPKWMFFFMENPIKIWLVVSNIFYVHPYLGEWSNLINIFQRGWFNHQPEMDDLGCGKPHYFPERNPYLPGGRVPIFHFVRCQAALSFIFQHWKLRKEARFWTWVEMAGNQLMIFRWWFLSVIFQWFSWSLL